MCVYRWPASVCANDPELCAQMTRPPHFACMCFLLRSPLLLKPSFFLPQILMSFWGSEILKVRLCISFGVFVFVLMVSGTLVILFIYQCLVCEDSGRAWKNTRAPPPFQALQSWALNLASKYVDCWIYAYGMMHICEHLVKQVLVPHCGLIYNLLDAIAFRHKQTWCLKMANNVNTQGFSGLDTGPIQERLTLVFWGIMFQHTNFKTHHQTIQKVSLCEQCHSAVEPANLPKQKLREKEDQPAAQWTERDDGSKWSQWLLFQVHWSFDKLYR